MRINGQTFARIPQELTLMIKKTDRAFEAAEDALDRTEDYALKIGTITDKYACILEPSSKKIGLSKTSLALTAVAVVVVVVVVGSDVFAAT